MKKPTPLEAGFSQLSPFYINMHFLVLQASSRQLRFPLAKIREQSALATPLRPGSIIPRAAVAVLWISIAFLKHIGDMELAVVDRVFVTVAFHSGAAFASVSFERKRKVVGADSQCIPAMLSAPIT